MPIGNGRAFYGDGSSDFTVKQFMLDLTDEARVAFIMDLYGFDDRKQATDRNYQMKLYWLQGERTGAARPQYDILKAFIISHLREEHENEEDEVYTFADSYTDALEAFAERSDTTFSPRQASSSDKITSIMGWLHSLYLSHMAVIVVQDYIATVWIAQDS